MLFGTLMAAGLWWASRLLFAADLESQLIFPLNPKHNHSSCIVECPNGDLIACWYRGSGERSADDVQILGARLRAGSKTWSEPFLMADTPGYPDCNPVVFVDPRQQLWVFWPTIIDHHWESAVLKFRRSNDYLGDGPPKWDWQDVMHITPKGLDQALLQAIAAFPAALRQTHPRFDNYLKIAEARAKQELYLRLGWMPRCRPLQLPSGRWLIPLYCDTFSISIVAIVNREGTEWATSSPILGFGAIQPTLVRKNDGTIVAYLRDNGPSKKIKVCESKDEGMTWGPVRDSAMPNPGASVDAIRLQNGHWVLVHNDTQRGRHSLAISLSDDEGASWKWTRHLELWERDKGSASYPSVLQAKDGRIHVTYSYRASQPGSTIKHVRMTEDWIKAGDKGGVAPNQLHD